MKVTLYIYYKRFATENVGEELFQNCTKNHNNNECEFHKFASSVKVAKFETVVDFQHSTQPCTTHSTARHRKRVCVFEGAHQGRL